MIFLLLCAAAASTGAQMMGAGGGGGQPPGILAPPGPIPPPPPVLPVGVPNLWNIPPPPIPFPPLLPPAVPQWQQQPPNAAVGQYHWHAGPGDIVTWLAEGFYIRPGLPDLSVISLLPLTFALDGNSMTSPEVWLARDAMTALRRACFRHFEAMCYNVLFTNISTK